MGITKRNDSEGWRRGAMGMDDVADRRHQFDRSWNVGNLKKSDFQAMDCDYTEEGAGGSELLENARRGNRPLLGRGSPESAEQTGFRKRRSGAF
jgi:hypothetical protein